MTTVPERCDGILAGTECCEPGLDETLGEPRAAYTQNMQKFARVMGEGAHRYESCLNPSLCDTDISQLGELSSSLIPLRHRSVWLKDVDEDTTSRTQAFETCAKHQARYVELSVQLQQTESCNFNHSGAFCAPVSCAAPYEKWVLSAMYFAHQAPECAKFASQPCVWQNAARLQRLVHVRDLPLVFDRIEIFPPSLARHQPPANLRASTDSLLKALGEMGDSDLLIPWAALRPFADAAQPPGRPGPLIVGHSLPSLRHLPGLKIVIFMTAPSLCTLLCLRDAWDGQELWPGFYRRFAAGCKPKHLEHLEMLFEPSRGPVELRLPSRSQLEPLCKEHWFAAAAMLEGEMETERQKVALALARAGLWTPPEVLLSLRELCELKMPRGAVKEESPAICAPSAGPRMAAEPSERPTGCSCRATVQPCLTSAESKRCPESGGRRAVVAAFDLQIPLDQPYRTWGAHDAPLDFLLNFDLRQTSGPTPERVLLLPEPHLAVYPISARIQKRLRRAHVRVVEFPWIDPPGLSASVVERNKQNHFGNREYIRLHAFNLQEYDVVVYLDLDIRIVGDLAPAFNCGQQMFLSTGSNFAALDGGFFAVRPNRALFAAMLDVLQSVEYNSETGWNRLGHGRSIALGTAEGNYPAGPQGFLYHFFYMADPAVIAALARRRVAVLSSAQLHSCRWNYGSHHGEFFWRYVDEESYFRAMQPDWRDQAKQFFETVGEWTFPCDFTLEPPVIVHHMDDAMESYLSYISSKNFSIAK